MLRRPPTHAPRSLLPAFSAGHTLRRCAPVGLALLAACGPGGEPIIEAPVFSVAVSGPNTVEEGSTIQLAAAVASTGELPSQAVTWTSGNTDVARVDGSGVVTGVSAGTASITATSVEDASASAVHTVTVTTAASIRGLVFNDRDGDGGVDPDEALNGAVLKLTGPVARTTTTDASGAYAFTQLPAGTYTVSWDPGTPSGNVNVLRSLGQPSQLTVTVAAGQAAGTTTSASLPRWNDGSGAGINLGSTHFTFLFLNNVVLGTATTGGRAPIAGMTMSLRRCRTSVGATSPPIAVSTSRRCTAYLGSTINAVTDQNGGVVFAGMMEGVYEITPQPGTVGGFTTASPAQALYLLKGNGDIEDMTFVIR